MTARKKNSLPYPPPYQDQAMLAQHLTISPSTVPLWVEQGVIPPPREVGGKLIWKWAEVDEMLTVGKEGSKPDAQAERIRNASKRIAAASH